MEIYEDEEGSEEEEDSDEEDGKYTVMLKYWDT